MKSNFISLNRKIKDWKWYKRPNTFRLFIHILLKANFKDKEWEGIKIKRGTFITSADKLALELGLSRQKIRTALRHLTETKEIKVSTNPMHTLITVNKYDEYQIKEGDNQPLTNQQPAINQPITTTNNVNKVNNVNNVAEDINIIIKKVSEDALYIEHLCMKNSKKPYIVKRRMETFRDFLHGKGQYQITLQSFKKTFAGFLRKSEQNRHDNITM